MSEPSLELQRAIYQALIASTPLKSAMGGAVRAYDRVPPAPSFPYLTLSEAQLLDDGVACEDNMFEAFVDLHVWSRTVGQAEAKTISGIVRSEMMALTLATDWQIKVSRVQAIRYLNDPDGLTAHSIITCRFLLEPIGD